MSAQPQKKKKISLIVAGLVVIGCQWSLKSAPLWAPKSAPL